MPTFSFKPTFSSQVAKEFVAQLGESPQCEEVLCVCPFCDGPSNDRSKKTLSVNVSKGKFYCFHCHRSGGSVEMAQGISTGGALFKKAREKTVLTQEAIVFAPITVPVGSLPPGIRDRVVNDLRARQVFSDEDILRLEYGMSGSRPKRWVGRVIVSTDGVKFAKAIQVEGQPAIRPKYLTEPNFKLVDHGYIGINELTRSNRPAILAEGLLDYHSLPEGDRLMSPGTSGLFNDLVRTTSHQRPLVVVPDDDEAGVKAFLRIINKGLIADPQAQLKFCFVYWVTGDENNDINDLHCGLANGDSQQTYDALVTASMDAPSALKRLQKRFKLVKTKSKGWIIQPEKPNGTKRPVDKDFRSLVQSRARENRNSKLSWF